MPLIVEGVVTTLNPSGTVNVAAAGPMVQRNAAGEFTRLTFRLYQGSQTLDNLRRIPEGVFHVTDDAALIARAALDLLGELPPLAPSQRVRVMRLADCCRAYEFRVIADDFGPPRSQLDAEVVAVCQGRPFLGFNRARHALIEAAIAASRRHLLGVEAIAAQLDRAEQAIERTGGPPEREALAAIRARESVPERIDDQ